jgi:hypothetical protein
MLKSKTMKTTLDKYKKLFPQNYLGFAVLGLGLPLQTLGPWVAGAEPSSVKKACSP